jgi:hypothetical protein
VAGTERQADRQGRGNAPLTNNSFESFGVRHISGVTMEIPVRTSLLLAAVAVAALPAGTLAAKPVHRHHPVQAAAPQRIACTVLGCAPIPAQCMPQGGKTLGGLPTGYDVIVCPPGVQPLR